MKKKIKYQFQGTKSFANGWFFPTEGNWYKNITKKMHNAKIIEIGSFEGLSLSYIKNTINSNKNKIWSVDIHAREKLIKNCKDWNITFINKSSYEASKLFDDKYFDLIFIDANHNYEYVKEDILSWLPKLKNNGIISGHDYDWVGVRKAVDEIIKSAKIKNRIWWKKIYMF